MNYQNKGLQVSFAIHAIVFIIISGISNLAIPLAKPIVIDFSIVSSEKSGVGSQELVQTQTKSKVKRQESLIREQNPEPENPKQEIAASTSEAQVPVSASLPARTEQAVEQDGGHNLAAQSKADGLSAGRDAIGSAASGSGSESSIEKAKMGYLKKHFAYIRDMIMKNISYPHMARKMGWEGKVVISFVVEESGRVEDIRVIESSGIGLLDKNAVQTIIKASPFPKPPIKAALIIPVVYKLN